MSKGTYAALRVFSKSAERIRSFCERNGITIISSEFEQRLHCTLIYSRVHCPNMVPEEFRSYMAKFKGWQIFDNRESGDKVLVMELYAPSIVARHNYLMDKHNATYDFPDYNPHISITYDFAGNISDLESYDDDILLGFEYVEELDLEAK